jgi:hypothetical protein
MFLLRWYLRISRKPWRRCRELRHSTAAALRGSFLSRARPPASRRERYFIPKSPRSTHRKSPSATTRRCDHRAGRQGNWSGEKGLYVPRYASCQQLESLYQCRAWELLNGVFALVWRPRVGWNSRASAANGRSDLCRHCAGHCDTPFRNLERIGSARFARFGAAGSLSTSWAAFRSGMEASDTSLG